jgi:hypothetical protein
MEPARGSYLILKSPEVLGLNGAAEAVNPEKETKRRNDEVNLGA